MTDQPTKELGDAARAGKKRHHFVSVTYLEGFCDEAGKITAYRKDTPENPLHLKPDEVGFENYYYSQTLPDGTRDNDRFEDLWGRVETNWPAVRTAANAGSIDGQLLFELYKFVPMMRSRIPAAREYHESALALKMRTEIKTLAEIGKLPAKLRRYENELDTVPVAVNRQQTLNTMTDDMRRFGDLTRKMGFELLLNQTVHDFITSDNPVAYFDPSISFHKLRPYEVDRQVELYFPIDARTLLRGSHRLRFRGHAPSIRRVDNPEVVLRMNRMTARFGYRFIFAKDRSCEKLAIAHSKMSPVLDARLDGKGREIKIYLRHKFGERPRLNKFRPDRCEDALTADVFET